MSKEKKKNNLFKKYFTQYLKLPKKQFLSITVGFFIFLLSCLVVSKWDQIHLRLKQENKVYTQFELRVINHDGRAIVGAKIFDGKELLGLTDSFGEWRRYLRYPPGKSLVLKITKRKNDKQLFASKNFLIPLKDISDEIRIIKSSIIIKSQRNKKNKDIEKHYGVWFSIFNPRPLSQNLKAKMRLQKILSALYYESKNIGLKLNRHSPWQVKLAHLPFEKRYGKQKGLLRLVSSSPWQAKNEKIDFLQNYSPSENVSAKKILAQLKNHLSRSYLVKKHNEIWYVRQVSPQNSFWQLSFHQELKTKNNHRILVGKRSRWSKKWLHLKTFKEPCPQLKNNCFVYNLAFPKNAPHAAWQKRQVKLNLKRSQEKNFYIGGLKAYFIGSNLWSYWAKESKGTYLSLLEDGKITFRSYLKISSNIPNLNINSKF